MGIAPFRLVMHEHILHGKYKSGDESSTTQTSEIRQCQCHGMTLVTEFTYMHPPEADTMYNKIGLGMGIC